MDKMEKLRVLIPHWLEHNKSHADEWMKWADTAGEEGHPEVSALMKKAIAAMDSVDELLQMALKDAGGGDGDVHHHHHHHHHG